MSCYGYSYELYHYGIKGMKWGHRKARSNTSSRYETKYKTKELKRLDTKWKGNEKQVAKAETQLKELQSKNGAPRQKIDRAKQKLAVAKAEDYYAKGMKAAEASSIKRMKVADIKYEKKQVGRNRAISALSIVGAAAVSSRGGVGVYVTSNASTYKTNTRVSADKRNSIGKAAIKKAKKEVYNK